MKELIRYVYKKYKYLIKIRDDKKIAYEEEIDNLDIDDKEKGFIRLVFTINGVDISSNYIEAKDKPKRVQDLNYGEIQNNGMGYLDKPVIAKIKYCGDEIVFENYDELDDFILNHFLPDNVQMKVNFSRNRKDLSTKKPYPSVQLNKIVKLGLSEQELRHVLNFIQNEGIHVGGKASEIEGEFETYDYISSNDIVQNYYKVYCSDELSKKEMQDKFIEFYETKDPVLREELILRNLRLVPYCSWGIARNYEVSKEELDSYGYEALVNAVDNYNPYLDATFATYAVACIDGKLLGSIPEIKGIDTKSMNYLYYKFRNAKNIVERDSGCTIEEDPSLIDDLVDILVYQGYIDGDNPERVKEIKKVIVNNFIGNVSYEEYFSKHDLVLDEYHAYNMGNIFAESFYHVIEKEMNSSLTDREKIVINLRFGFDGDGPKTLDKIAKVLGVTRERVRQVEAKAIRKLSRARSTEYIKGFELGTIEYDADNKQVIPIEEDNNKTM